MKSVKSLWNQIINIGITPNLHEKDAKYIRLTNGISVIAGIWLLSLIPPWLPFYPSSKYIILNSIIFPLLWLLVLYFNYKKLKR
jgi:adenylate cyclase